MLSLFPRRYTGSDWYLENNQAAVDSYDYSEVVRALVTTWDDLVPDKKF